MMIDIPDMGDVWFEIRDHASKLFPGFGRIDRMGRLRNMLMHPFLFAFEIDVWN
jgi:hypothetical protein